MASEAQIQANRRNAARSTGPSEQGKIQSRANSLKHGLTGAGIVMTEADAAEVDRLTEQLEDELRPSGAVGQILIRQMAKHAIRMERCADRENAAQSARVRQVLNEFEAPEGSDPADFEALREEAGRIAMFDPSKEACLARKYEASSERGFYRSLKEFRQVERESKAEAGPSEAQAIAQKLASFFPADPPPRSAPAPAHKPTAPPAPAASKPAKPAEKPSITPRDPMFDDPFGISSGSSYVPIAIGRPRLEAVGGQKS